MNINSIIEELKKEERRREIRAKISKIKAMISEVNATKQAYGAYAAKIRATIERWQHQYQGYMQIALANPINEKDFFEGVCADGFAASMPAAMGELNTTDAQMSAVVSGIQDQIAKIEKYITKLQLQIAALEAELAAI